MDDQLRGELLDLRSTVTSEATGIRLELGQLVGKVDVVQATLLGHIQVAQTERNQLGVRVAKVEQTLDAVDERLDNVWFDRGKLVGFAVGVVAASGGVAAAVAQLLG